MSEGRRLLPRLRFPEFRRVDGWEHKQLGLACQMQAGKFVSASEIQEQNSQGLHPCYGGNGLRGYTATFTHSGKYSLIGRQGALCGNVKQGIGRFHATEHAIVVTPKNGVAGDWLFFILEFLNLNRFATGQAQPGLSVDVLEKLPIAVPSHELEQRKVADCLSSLDWLIAAQARKVNSLEIQKKGLMQRIFPREGETRPRLRFIEFQDAGAWTTKTLIQLVDIQSGGTPSKENSAFWNGTIPWVSAKDMKRLFLEDSEDRISTDAVSDGARLVPQGTLLMLTRGMTLLKDVPICVTRCEMSFNQDVKALRPKNEVDGLFLAWMLASNKRRLLDMVDTAGHGTGKLDTNKLKAFEVMLPQPLEQNRIANCLTSIDDVIAAQTQELEALKTHKKGLMQQLFPSAEAVEA